MNGISEWFPAGPPIREEQQIGRGPFIDSLEDRMLGAEKVKLLEGRRSGKSSVGQAVVRRFHAGDRPAAQIDLSRVADAAHASDLLAEQLAPALALAGQAKRATGWLAGMFAKLDQQSAEGTVAGVVAELLGDRKSPAEVLERSANALAGETGVVLIDEAHRLTGWTLEHQQGLREFLRNDTRVGVIIASSERSALERLTGEGQPFQYVGQRLPLPRIADEDWRAALPARFEAVGAPLDDDALALILEESRGHPYCTMLLARESARAGLAGAATTITAVYAGLLTARRDEAWELRDAP